MEKVTFDINNETVVANLYSPKNNNSRSPALVFTGPYTGVKEQVTGTYARELSEKGFTCLALDHRNFGESGGVLRQHEEPQKKLDDLAAATGFLTTLETVDPNRIGAVGICLGGSYALRFAGFDPRIKALATVAAAYVGFAPANPEEAAAKTEWMLGYADELNKLATGAPSRIAAVSDQPGIEAGMPGQEPFDYYGTQRSYSPHWVNEITRLSSYNLASFDAVTATQHLQKTPTLVVHGTTDAFCSPENAERAYNMMDADKQLEWIETTNHIELYDSASHVEKSVGLVADWMRQNLRD